MFTIPSGARLLITAELAPAQGDRFQPTGFPDLGAATYTLADGTNMLLVESAQSMANRLESVCWDEGRDDLVSCLAGLPYVDVRNAAGSRLTTSLHEAHRLNSAYIEKSDGFDQIKTAVGYEKTDGLAFDRRKLARALLRHDPNSLLHGCFLESIAGVIRLPRMISAFVEARDVRIVASGGVKNDRLDASGTDSGGAASGFGNVPFHRDEYTAAGLNAYFNLDLGLLRGLGLGDEAEQLLSSLALYKVRAFLDDGLRLRTACDLDLRILNVTRPSGIVLPSRAELEAALPAAIARVAATGAFATPAITRVTFTGGDAPKAAAKGAKPRKPQKDA